MADRRSDQSPSPHFYGIRHLGDACRICKLFVKKLYPISDKRNNKGKHKSQSIELECKALHDHNNHSNSQETMNGSTHEFNRCTINDEISPKAKPNDKAYFTSSRSPLSSPCSRSASPLSHPRNASPSPLSRSSSKRSQTPIRSAAANLLRNMSRRKGQAEETTLPSSLSRNASRRSSTAIIYSNSNMVILKPPPMQKTLECTLEELCFGCIKKISITRDSVTGEGEILQEDEVLTIKVEPGWRTGTKITFEGIGNETPGAEPGDVVFTIAEKQHRLYSRQGEDDLEFAMEIPLVTALSGCSLPIPLLGGEKMIVTIDDVICPGYHKIIEGQGMPKPHDQAKRGNLIVTLLVKFPTELSEDQKSDISNILHDS